MRVRTLDGGTSFEVEGDHGVYRITHWSPPYEEDVHVWSCDCPAGRSHRDCKHVRAFAAWYNQAAPCGSQFVPLEA